MALIDELTDEDVHNLYDAIAIQAALLDIEGQKPAEILPIDCLVAINKVSRLILHEEMGVMVQRMRMN